MKLFFHDNVWESDVIAYLTFLFSLWECFCKPEWWLYVNIVVDQLSEILRPDNLAVRSHIVNNRSHHYFKVIDFSSQREVEPGASRGRLLPRISSYSALFCTLIKVLQYRDGAPFWVEEKDNFYDFVEWFMHQEGGECLFKVPLKKVLFNFLKTFLKVSLKKQMIYLLLQINHEKHFFLRYLICDNKYTITLAAVVGMIVAYFVSNILNFNFIFL